MDMNNLNNTPDSTGQFTPEDIQNNKIMAICSYLFLLVLVPIFAAKDSPFAKFHVNQGLVLLLADIVLGIATRILAFIPILGGIISWLLYVAIAVLSIIGIINAAQGKAKQLPLIGGIQLMK